MVVFNISEDVSKVFGRFWHVVQLHKLKSSKVSVGFSDVLRHFSVIELFV